MKFTQNTPVVNPTTIGNTRIRPVTDPMAYGTAGKEYEAMAGALGQVARVAKQQQDDMDAADHMNRRNIIMGNITKRLYGEDGLITNGVGINAKGLTDRVQQVVQEEFERGMDGANQRVRRSMAGTFNENMGNYQRIAAQQEGREFNRQKEIDYNANQGLNIDRAVAGYRDNNSVTFAVNDGMQLLHYRAKDQGWSNAQLEQEKRKLIGAIAGSAIQTAIDSSDLEQADNLLTTYGAQMDQTARLKFDNILKKNSDIKMSREIGAELLKRFGGDKEKAKDYLYNVIGTETVSVGGREGHENAWVIYDVFKAAGFDDNAIAGILGRAQQEHNFSTDMAEEKDVPGIGRVGGFGMFQWQMDPAYGGRGIRFHQWAQENGYDANDSKVQAMYALQEAMEKGLTPQALNGKSAEEVADIWTRDWEGGKPGEERRYAGEWLGRIKKAAAGAGGNFDKGYNSIVGNKMDYGEVGCVEAVVKGGKAAGIPFFEKQAAAGVVDCDTLKQNASAAGIAVENFDPNNPPRKGDVIIYDRGEKQHAVTADGNGGYWGNSSSQGKVVHGSDYNEMGGKIPTQVIRTGQLGGSGSGGYTKRKYSEVQLNASWKQYEAQLIDHDQAEAYQKSERVKSYIDGAKGMTSQSDVVAYMDRVKADPTISIDDYNRIAGSVFGYYGLTRDGNEKGTRGGSGTGGGSSSRGRVEGVDGYTGVDGKWYSKEKYDAARENNIRYQEKLRLQEQGITKITPEEQKAAIESSKITNAVENANYKTNGLVSARKALDESGWDYMKAVNVLVNKGIMDDIAEASRYVSKVIENNQSDDE